MRLALFVDMFAFTALTFLLVYWLARIVDAITYAIGQWFAIRRRRLRLPPK